MSLRRIEIETTLNEGRVATLAKFASLDENVLKSPLTASEHDEHETWRAVDHLVHLALIERDFVRIVRRHLAGAEDPIGLATDQNGQPRDRAAVMAAVHAMTERFRREHADVTLSEAVAITAAARADTLTLLSELRDDQLDAVVPGAPWGDGTIGGIMMANAHHGQMHWTWVRDALASKNQSISAEAVPENTTPPS